MYTGSFKFFFRGTRCSGTSSTTSPTVNWTILVSCVNKIMVGKFYDIFKLIKVPLFISNKVNNLINSHIEQINYFQN